jgi:hypothetical protein
VAERERHRGSVFGDKIGDSAVSELKREKGRKVALAYTSAFGFPALPFVFAFWKNVGGL